MTTDISAKKKELRELLTVWNDSYHSSDVSIVSDAEYDKVFAELTALETKYPDTTDKSSLTTKVGATPTGTLSKLNHRVPMLSIQTITDTTMNGASQFNLAVSTLLKDNEIEYYTEPKYDGLGVSLCYSRGQLVAAVTRGNGSIGEDITAQIKHSVKNLPLSVSGLLAIDFIEIRGEVVMPIETFRLINLDRHTNGDKPLMNPRNAVAGMVRRLDLSQTPPSCLEFKGYGVGGLGSTEGSLPTWNTQYELNSILKEQGFDAYCELGSVCSANLLYNKYTDIQQLRSDLPYEIDGVVYKVNSLELQKRLGYRSREPKWAAAQKFVPMEQMSKVLAIDVQIGRTGKVTPVARLTPTYVGGVVVSNVTLHNLFDLRRRGVRVGSTVLLRRAGDVIPEITKTFPSESYLPNFRMPSECPVCGSKLIRERGSREYHCSGKLVCKVQLSNSIQHFSSRNAMNINGLGGETIDSLVSQGLLKNVADLYTLKKEDLLTLPSFGTTKAEKLLSSINVSKKVALQPFLYALGIPNVGEGTSKRLSKAFSSLGSLVSSELPQILDIRDIGTLTATSIYDFFHNEKNLEQLELLKRGGVVVTEAVESVKTDRVACITGTIDLCSRSELVERLKKVGVELSGTLNSTVDFFIVGKNPGSKLARAKAMGIPVLTETELVNTVLNT